MSRREKCPHCGTVAAFHDHFCTHCWSHRTKGKVLTEEQIATCRSQVAAGIEKVRWQAELGSCQRRLLIPTILMTLWCAYWGLSKMPVYLKDQEGLLTLVTGVLCAAGFAYGGFLAGGMKALPLACSLLILVSLVCVLHAGGFLVKELNLIAPHGWWVLWGCIRLVLCGLILVSCAEVLRLQRPGR